MKKSGFSMWSFGTRIPCIRSSARKAKKIWQDFLGHEENVHLHNLVVDLNPGKEEAFRAGHEAKHAENYRINSFHLGEGSPKQKFRANMDAIYTLKTLENQNRDATPEEQETLANYVGWGGLADAFDAEKTAWTGEYKELKAALTEEEYAAARASTLNAHYTSPTVIRAIYEALDGMGFEKGNILEPSMGVGNFFGMLPDSMLGSRLYGVELDSITGRIAQKLYPQAEIKVAGFETTDHRDFYDLAVGNVPFGNYRVSDKPYDKLGFSIHNYFFAKALDQVRPGGIVAFVTSRYTMDSKNPDARKYLAQRAELLGAIRLPNNAFRANAGTDVVSDIIFLQKRDHPIDIEPDWVHLGLTSEGLPSTATLLTTRKWCWVRLQRKVPSTARKNVRSFRFQMRIWETSCMRWCSTSAVIMKHRSWHRRKSCPCRAKLFRQTQM